MRHCEDVITHTYNIQCIYDLICNFKLNDIQCKLVLVVINVVNVSAVLSLLLHHLLEMTISVLFSCLFSSNSLYIVLLCHSCLRYTQYDM